MTIFPESLRTIVKEAAASNAGDVDKATDFAFREFSEEALRCFGLRADKSPVLKYCFAIFWLATHDDASRRPYSRQTYKST